jgi:hypothetical protein
VQNRRRTETQSTPFARVVALVVSRAGVAVLGASAAFVSDWSDEVERTGGGKGVSIAMGRTKL